DGDARLLDQQLGEFERAQMRELVGDRGPGEHRGGGGRDLPPCPAEAFDHDVAAAAIDLADFLDDVVGAVEGARGGDLYGGESAVVEVRLHARERRDQPLVADGEA